MWAQLSMAAPDRGLCCCRPILSVVCCLNDAVLAELRRRRFGWRAWEDRQYLDPSPLRPLLGLAAQHLQAPDLFQQVQVLLLSTHI